MTNIKDTAVLKENISLLSRLEIIMKKSRNSALEDMFFKDVEEHLKIVGETLNLSDVAVVFLAYFLENKDSSNISYRLAEYLDVSNMRILSYNYIMEELLQKQYIKLSRRFSDYTYKMSRNAVDSIVKGVKMEKLDYSKLTTMQFFKYIHQYFNSTRIGEFSQEALAEEIIELIKLTRHLSISSVLLKVRPDSMDLNYLFVHLYLAVYESKYEVLNDDIDRILGFEDYDYLKRSLSFGDNKLILDGWIESVCEDGLTSNTVFKLTKKGVDTFLKDVKLKRPKNNTLLKLHSSLPSKSLYYNKDEEQQINQLAELLDKDNFANIQKRLTENGLRSGFATLFYGYPGTGKTETVYQLAKKTGRNIYPVDISSVRSKWVGESEKNIKGIFNEYREITKISDEVPILLFNEADGVFGNRVSSKRSIDKMENTVQNIILEEMEKLNGILIATTNLTQNLDPAFERRFLYKIKFGTPSIKARMSIWNNMLPTLDDEELLYISKKYDLTGGQIENVVRKYTVNQMLTGETPSMSALSELCKSEHIGYSHTSKMAKVGFV